MKDTMFSNDIGFGIKIIIEDQPDIKTIHNIINEYNEEYNESVTNFCKKTKINLDDIDNISTAQLIRIITFIIANKTEIRLTINQESDTVFFVYLPYNLPFGYNDAEKEITKDELSQLFYDYYLDIDPDINPQTISHNIMITESLE